MRPNARSLALRDPALAILLGVLASAGPTADFGGEFGDEFGDDDMGDDFGDDDFGDDDFGAAPKKVNYQAAAKLWKQRARGAMATQKRKNLISPNRNSDLKVEKYSFTISQSLTLGTAVAFSSLTGQPDTTIRPQRVTMNAPAPMYAFIQDIKVANVSVSVGGGLEDAYNYNADGVGQSLDMPTLSPANRATVTGSYTGFVPPGYTGGTATYFSVSFKGPSTITA